MRLSSLMKIRENSNCTYVFLTKYYVKIAFDIDSVNSRYD